ncbi:MAG TPA: aminotransferase class V-fold PLP-dependent enzyme [Thermosynechococcaceae cyanobacterium]
MLNASTALLNFRQQFPALQNKAYFNYGGQGVLPQRSLAAVQQSFQQGQELGPFSGKAGTWVNQEADLTRQAIAAELGASPRTIALTENVTVGCNIALWGIDWRVGDRLLMTDCEHPGIVATVQELQRRFAIEVDICPLQSTLNAGDPIEVLVRHLHTDTRLVVLSHILWNTGQVLPLKEIVAACHSYNRANPVRVLVDAAQSIGVLPLNLTELNVDFYAFTGHKWWCGPEGVGGLYVRPEAQDLLPTFIGWRGITMGETGAPTGWKPDSRRYEVGTSAYPLYAGLREAIVLHQSQGTAQERYLRLLGLSRSLWQQLSELPGVKCLRSTPPQAGLVSFQLPGQSHGQLVQFLESRSILVRTIQNPDCVRACVHYFTLESEIAQLVEAVQQFDRA